MRRTHKIQRKAPNFTTIKIGRRAVIIWTDFNKQKDIVQISTIGFKQVQWVTTINKRKK